MFTQVSHPYLAETMPMSSANDVRYLLPMSFSSSCPSSRTTVFLVFRVLMPVSSFASCSSSPCSDARHHLVLTLVITSLSGSCLLRRCFQRFSSSVFTLFVVKSSPYRVKSLHKKSVNKLLRLRSSLYFRYVVCYTGKLG